MARYAGQHRVGLSPIRPFDAWIDPEIVSAPESSTRELEQFRQELRDRRDAAVRLYSQHSLVLRRPESVR